MSSTTRTMAILLILAAGCRGDDDGMTPDGGPGGDGGGSHTIYQIQMGAVTLGTEVTLRGVVVVAIDEYGGDTGGIYVAEPAGGAFSGVYVYGTPIATIDTLAPGDLVDITGGIVDEFALAADTTGRTLTEISPPQGGGITVTKTGTGTIPAPEVVSSQALAADDAEAEKWEGVLIRFENVAVTGTIDEINAANLLYQQQLSGPFLMDSSMTSLGDATTPMFVPGDCLAQVTGMGSYFFNYKILPRSAADLQTGGTCAAEDTMALCMNMLDDDGDGFTDCEDFDCQQILPSCVMDALINDVQDGTLPVGSAVQFTDVIVTAVFDDTGMNNNDMVWVEEPGAGQYSGIAVFKPTIVGATITTLAIGDMVTVSGNVQEAFMETQIAGMGATITFTAAGTAPAAEAIADPSSIATGGATAENYEGVLVTVTNVKVVSANPDGMMDFGEWSVGATATPLRIDNQMTPRPAVLVVDQCIASITGVLRFSFSNFKLEPRSSADIVLVGGICP